MLLGMGNPLLDISAVVGKELLDKYDMKPNDAILAEEKHKPLNDELIQKYNAEYIAGGSAQNTLRVAQWFLEKPNVVTYFGCVGRDKYADILREKTKICGLNAVYQSQEDVPTGTCSVLITGHQRSLCANLSAANHFTIEHVHENKKYVEMAGYYYVSVSSIWYIYLYFSIGPQWPKCGSFLVVAHMPDLSKYALKQIQI